MLTVILSSRNGAAVLRQTLDGLVAMTTPAERWKLVAVDNASSDNTQEVLQSYQDRLPITVLSEPAPGKNKAVNRALDHAEGDLYVFCDDDIIVAKDWLIKWREVADTHEECDLFAASVLPCWPHDPPHWLSGDKNGHIFFSTNEYMREGPCEATDMFGANMAIRASVFATGLRFNVGIGPDGSASYAMGSETEFASRLAALGYKCWFAPGPFVKHIIRANQMRREWILGRGYRWGRGNARMNLPHHYVPKKLSWKNFLRANLYPILMPFMSEAEAWARHWEWAVDEGYEDGYRAAHGLPPRWLKTGKSLYIAQRFRND
ncbi:MAG: glycosyltransferase [Alphaproteobacteria bacterium]